MQAATVSEDKRDTSNMGRPRLVEGTDTKPVTFRVPEPVHTASMDLPYGQRARVLRLFFEAYMQLDPSDRPHLEDADIMRAALSKAVKMSRALDH